MANDINKSIVGVLNTLADKTTKEIKSLLRLNGKYASGRLVNSVVVKVLETDKGVKMSLEYADYGKYVISGRRPGAKMPPISKIQAWTRLKGIPLSAAFPIARAIAKNGIKPLNFTTPFIRLDRVVSKVVASDKSLQNKIKELVLSDFKKK